MYLHGRLVNPIAKADNEFLNETSFESTQNPLFQLWPVIVLRMIWVRIHGEHIMEANKNVPSLSFILGE